MQGRLGRWLPVTVTLQYYNKLAGIRMNIHLFVIFGKNANKSPVAHSLRTQGVNLEVFCDEVRLNYKRKALRYLLGLPRLLLFSMQSVRASQLSTPKADVIIVNSHFDVLAFAIRRALLGAPIPRIVLPGFIYTTKYILPIRKIKFKYYSYILSLCRVVICHSRLEVETYEDIFGSCHTRFVYYPYALNVGGAKGFDENTAISRVVVTAGRSGRDYPLLIEAVKDLDIELHLISDMLDDIDLSTIPKYVKVLDECYGDSYFRELSRCRFVVLPIKVSDISAGQMVLLQSMAFGKPVIITRTETTKDYVSDGEGVLFVEQGNLADLRRAIIRLLSDDRLCSELGKKAAELFNRKYSIEAYAINLYSAACIALEDR